MARIRGLLLRRARELRDLRALYEALPGPHLSKQAFARDRTPSGARTQGMSDDDKQRTPFSPEQDDDTPLGDSSEHSTADEGAPVGDDAEQR